MCIETTYVIHFQKCYFWKCKNQKFAPRRFENDSVTLESVNVSVHSAIQFVSEWQNLPIFTLKKI